MRAMQSEKSDKKAVLIGVVFGVVGGLGWFVGLILQINLMGHGSFTPVNYFGAAMMFISPVIIILGAWWARSYTETALLLNLAWVEIGFASMLILMPVLNMLFADRYFAKGEKLKALRLAEIEHSVDQNEMALAIEREGRKDIMIVGHYKGNDGTIVDGFVIGPPEEFSQGDIFLNTGKICRFAWVNPSAPHKSFTEKPNEKVRRFIFLICDAKGTIQMSTTYRNLTLGPPKKRPLFIGGNEIFKDQRKKWLGLF